MESKAEMASRGVNSPDVADAFVMAFGVQPILSHSWLPYEDSDRAGIARAHGWQYAEDSDGQPGRSEDRAGLSAFGVHNTW
jgi:hypothetical protein